MTKIGLLSDTHNYLDETICEHFKHCEEIWHAGDFGTVDIADKLREGVKDAGGRQPIVRGVFGNIDGYDVRSVYPEKLRWKCERVEVAMTHIGGYPPKYNPTVKKELWADPPQLFICGHSHILKVMYDAGLGCLHMNPGAAGRQGWQKVRTVIRFVIDGKDIKDCEVIELTK